MDLPDLAGHDPQEGSAAWKLSFMWVCQIVYGSASIDPQVSRSGSARLSIGLLAMIPKLVGRALLHVFSSIKWVCQIVNGSATQDPQVSRKSSAACTLIYLVGLPDYSWVC